MPSPIAAVDPAASKVEGAAPPGTSALVTHTVDVVDGTRIPVGGATVGAPATGSAPGGAL